MTFSEENKILIEEPEPEILLEKQFVEEPEILLWEKQFLEEEDVLVTWSSTALCVYSEVLFVILPLAVLYIVFLYQGRKFGDLLRTPELSFATTILFGQALVKFFTGTSFGKKKRWEFFASLAATVIVIGLIPSVIILVLVLITQPPIPCGLVWAQGIWFILGVLVAGTMWMYGQFTLSKHSIDKKLT
jgi:hypothetical protein